MARDTRATRAKAQGGAAVTTSSFMSMSDSDSANGNSNGDRASESDKSAKISEAAATAVAAITNVQAGDTMEIAVVHIPVGKNNEENQGEGEEHANPSENGSEGKPGDGPVKKKRKTVGWDSATTQGKLSTQKRVERPRKKRKKKRYYAKKSAEEEIALDRRKGEKQKKDISTPKAATAATTKKKKKTGTRKTKIGKHGDRATRPGVIQSFLRLVLVTDPAAQVPHKHILRLWNLFLKHSVTRPSDSELFLDDNIMSWIRGPVFPGHQHSASSLPKKQYLATYGEDPWAQFMVEYGVRLRHPHAWIADFQSEAYAASYALHYKFDGDRRHDEVRAAEQLAAVGAGLDPRRKAVRLGHPLDKRTDGLELLAVDVAQGDGGVLERGTRKDVD